MIKIFRRIRFDLMEKNKTAKYFKYALGEIVLVVFGILIALQINNYNENRKNRVSENYYLGQIVIELKDDIRTLQNEKETLEEQIPIIVHLLDVFDDEKPDTITFNEALKNYMNAAWYVMRFESNSASFEEMKSSGKLGLIKDNVLRNNIVVLYKNLENCSKMFKSNNEFLTPHAIDFNFYKGMTIFLKDQKLMFRKFNSDEALYEKRKFRDDFINNAANQNWTIAEILPAINVQMEEIQNVLDQIENLFPRLNSDL